MSEFVDLYVKAYMSRSQRDLWRDFITVVKNASENDIIGGGGSDSFPTDPTSVNGSLQMLVFAGIENVSQAELEEATSKNHTMRRLWMGDIKTARAIDFDTNTIAHEVVYIEVFDNLDTDGNHVSLEIETDNDTIYPPSIQNMRRRILRLNVDRRRDALPLWMRTIQPGAIVEQGYTKAIPLCYTLPGRSAAVAFRLRQALRQSGSPQYTDIDFKFDRYVVAQMGQLQGDSFVVFPRNGN